MRYIILSDIHGNLQALEAVIESFPGGEKPVVVCAGDVVGYGADPDRCIESVISLSAMTVLGNHDAAVTGACNAHNFNRYAREAVFWTRKHISEEGRGYLESLPLILKEGPLTLVHGTLHEAERFRYMLTGADAMHTFEALNTKICFVGHSHIPGVFKFENGKALRLFKKEVGLEKESRYIVNVGSVGQPRDNDSRACYCIYDTGQEKIELKRVEYDTAKARQRIIDADLPEMLGDRLLVGQ